MASETDAGEDLAMRRRRLRYRAAHRGTRELDLLLGAYAEGKCDAMDRAELDAFEQLLSEEETSLQTWLLGREDPPHQHRPLIATILAFRAAGFPS